MVDSVEVDRQESRVRLGEGGGVGVVVRIRAVYRLGHYRLHLGEIVTTVQGRKQEHGTFVILFSGDYSHSAAL